MKMFKKIGLLSMFWVLVMAAFAVVGVDQAVAQTTACGDTTWTLWVGKDSTDVGSVTVCNDATNLYVNYTLDYPGAYLGVLHLWVGNDITLVPGAPTPGQFPFISGQGSFPSSEGLTTYTFTIPFSAINVAGLPTSTTCAPISLFVVTHANVFMPNGDGTYTEKTGFGGDVNVVDGGRWWWYGQYTVCCDYAGTGGGVCFNETAFAKGGWIFSSDKKANPEKLPSLNLIKNRWGWAINLTATGTSVYDIYAGAGLNNTSKATKVGTLTIDWNGTNASVAYAMFPGYFLEEVHIYAGDARPTTTAPGQYGYPIEGYDVGGVANFSYVVPLADTNGVDGVWLIVHALVSNGQCDWL